MEGHRYAQHQPKAKGAQIAQQGRAIHTVQLACAQILAGKGDAGLGKGIHDAVHKALNAVGCGGTGHGSAAKAVDGGLHHHIGHIEHDALHTGGQANGDDQAQRLGRKAQKAHIQMQGALLTHEDAHHHKGRNALADHSGQAHTGHAHIKYDHKNQVEHHIHKARSRQAIQRAAGVAHAAQQRRAKVIDHGDGHTAKVNAQIQNRHIQHIGGGAHGHQQGPGSQNAHHGQHAAADHAQQHGGVYGFLHAVIIA